MKKIATVCTVIALCAGYALPADNEKEDGKKTPPGLQKKGGVPPGQAKKKGQSDEAAPAAAPAPANTPAAAAAPANNVPATAPATANPATPAAAPAATATPAVAKPATTPAKGPTLAEQKAALDKHAHAINQVTKSNLGAHKVALQHISKETGVSLDHLKEQDKSFPTASDTGLLLGNVIAKKANVKFADVIKAHDSGKHWDEIAKAHNVDFALLVQKSSDLAQAVRAK